MVEFATRAKVNLCFANVRVITQANSAILPYPLLQNGMMIVLQVHAGMVEHVIQVEDNLPYVDVLMTMLVTSVRKGMMPAHPTHAKMMESAFQKMTGRSSANARKDTRANIVMTKVKIASQ